jgi:hypothetical protein
MADSSSENPRVDRTAFRVFSSFDEAERADREFWFSKTPIERLQHTELLRELNYGREVIDAGVQRIIAVFERPKRQPEPGRPG